MEITLNDKKYKLVFNSLAVYDLEDLFDKSLIDILGDEKMMGSVRTVIKIVWAGLLHIEEGGQPKFSLEDVKKGFPLETWKDTVTDLVIIIGESLGITKEAIKEKQAELEKKT